MNPTKRLPGLDFLRALAVISVVTYHYPKVPDQIVLRAMTHYGWAGVDLFFVLSGFLIGGQFFLIQTQGQAMDLVPFYLRRFFRTLPNYVVVLAISYFCARTQGTLFPDFWKYLLFIQNFGLPTIFSNSWSLCVEEQFYVFFPIIGILTARRLKDKSFTLLFISLLVAGWTLRAWIWSHSRPDLILSSDPDGAFGKYLGQIYYPTYTHLDGLLVGIALSAVKVFRPDYWSKLLHQGTRFLIGGLLTLGLSAAVLYAQMSFLGVVLGFTFLAAGFGMLLIAAVSEKTLIGRLKIFGTETIALLSYAMYLTHPMALELSVRLTARWGWSPVGPGMVFLSTVLIGSMAFGLYWLVERPMMRLREKVLTQKRLKRAEIAVTAAAP